jgi:outer membrane scaffolding protein for murein synthesis (MipA/OmpV family)
MILNPILVATFLIVGASTALAANVGGTQSYESQLSGATDTAFDFSGSTDWSGIVGGGIGLNPEFIGSSDYKISALPLFDVEWRGAYFASTQRGVGLNFYRRSGLKMGPRLTYDRGRESSESTFLAGLPDVDGTVEIGAFLETLNGPWRFKGDFRKGLGGHEGFVASLDLAISGRLNDRANLILGATTHYASKDYMKSYFDSTVVGTLRPVFASDGGGFSDIGGYATIVRNFTDRIFISGVIRGTLLIGDAADSPISQSDGQYFFGTIFGYRF